MQYFRIKEWSQYQHYKDRDPPWIKLHRKLLTSATWVMLDDASKALAVACMLLAAATGNKVPFDPDYVQRAGYLKTKPRFDGLIKTDFIEIIDDSGEVLADASNLQANACPEGETETDHIKAMSGKPDLRPQAIEVINFLNSKAVRNFEPVDANLKLIIARLRQGASVQDMKSVVAKKVREWGGNVKMQEYLRPKTLFNETNFAQYKGELVEAPHE